MAFENLEIWWVTGAQLLYGGDAVVAVDAHSGLAGIAYWINAYFNATKSNKIDKKSETVEKIKAMVDKEYENGRTASMSDGELVLMLKKVDPDLYKKLTSLNK